MSMLPQQPEHNECEIGIALAHYHSKIGPQYVAGSTDLDNFPEQTIRNILQDSLASKTDDLALFLINKQNKPQMVRIQKVIVKNEEARGKTMRYALILIIPLDITAFNINLGEIAEQVQDQISQNLFVSHSQGISSKKKNLAQFMQSLRSNLNTKFKCTAPKTIEEEYMALRKLLYGKNVKK